MTDRLLFGSDFPVMTTQAAADAFRAINDWEDGVRLPPIPPELIEQILYERPLEAPRPRLSECGRRPPARGPRVAPTAGSMDTAGHSSPVSVVRPQRRRVMIAKGLSVLACLALLGAADARAQTYPRKPITVVVPFAAGGPTDTVARLLAQAMGEGPRADRSSWRTSAAPAAPSAPAASRSAKPDGYTILLHHIGMATAPALYRKLPYNPLDDFEHIGLVNDVPMTHRRASKDLPPNDLKELIAYIKANKDKVTYANAGIGAASHLCGMLFMSAIETDLTTVPYKGTGPAMNDLLGGQVDFMCDQTTNTTSQIKAGKIKVYARHLAEARAVAAGRPDHAAKPACRASRSSVWHGLYAPKGTPKPVIDKLVAALQAALRDPTVQTALRGSRAPSRVAESQRDARRRCSAHLKAEIDKWAPIIKKAGVYAD